MKQTRRYHRLLPSLVVTFSFAFLPTIIGCGANNDEPSVVRKTLAPEPQRQELVKPKAKSKAKPDKHKLQSFSKNEWVYV